MDDDQFEDPRRLPPSEWERHAKWLLSSIRYQLYRQVALDENAPPSDVLSPFVDVLNEISDKIGKVVAGTDLQASVNGLGKRSVAKFDPGFEYLILQSIMLLGKLGGGIVHKPTFESILRSYDANRTVEATWTKLDGWKNMETGPYVYWPKGNRQDITVTKFGEGYLATLQNEALHKSKEIEKALRGNGFENFSFPS